MTKTIPEIDDLIRGINDTDLALGNEHQEGKAANELPSPTGNETKPGQGEHPICADMEKFWNDFMSDLTAGDTKENREERLVCKIDRDLADSLDDCDIHNRCRSDLVNAIVRAFFGTFLPRLANYRREKKSLFANFKEERHV